MRALAGSNTNGGLTGCHILYLGALHAALKENHTLHQQRSALVRHPPRHSVSPNGACLHYYTLWKASSAIHYCVSLSIILCGWVRDNHSTHTGERRLTGLSRGRRTHKDFASTPPELTAFQRVRGTLRHHVSRDTLRVMCN